MKKSSAGVVILAFLFISGPRCSTCFAQGSLIPPGSPAPTMKSLDQIYSKLDGRIGITNTGAVTISQPGSYYLMTNILVGTNNGITITTNQVTLDLNGFTISSTNPAGSGFGISLSSNKDITIFNGHIVGSVTNTGSTYNGAGFASGIDSDSFPYNVRVSNVTVSGVKQYGIWLGMGYSTVIESCTVYVCGASGLTADVVSHSSARLCGYYGIYATVASDCIGYTTGAGYSGVRATTVNNSSGYAASAGVGLYADKMANGCYGYSASGTGLYAYNASFCTGERPSGTAIQATIANGCIAVSGTNLVTYKYNMP